MDEFIDKISAKQAGVTRSDKHQVLSTGLLVGPIRKHCRLTLADSRAFLTATYAIMLPQFAHDGQPVPRNHTQYIVQYKLTCPSGMYTWKKWATFLITAQ
jgi:hypothetical protein